MHTLFHHYGGRIMLFDGYFKLTEAQTGDAAVLNDKVFRLTFDEAKQIEFIDIYGNVLRQTTPMIGFKGNESEGTYTIGTKSGSVYKVKKVPTPAIESVPSSIPVTPQETFNKLLSLINEFEENNARLVTEAKRVIHEAESIFAQYNSPVTSIEPEPERNPNEIFGEFPRIIQETHHPDQWIHYKDGWQDKATYIFAEKITEEQFIKFCKLKGHRLDKLNDWQWYEDHADITNAKHEKDKWINPHAKLEPDTTWTYKWVRVYTD